MHHETAVVLILLAVVCEACFDPMCSGHGSCLTSTKTCFCEKGWYGESCALSQESCNSRTCNGKGHCRSGRNTVVNCECAPECGFTGQTCSTCPVHVQCSPLCTVVATEHKTPAPLEAKDSFNPAMLVVVALSLLACISTVVVYFGLKLRKYLASKHARHGTAYRDQDREGDDQEGQTGSMYKDERIDNTHTRRTRPKRKSSIKRSQPVIPSEMRHPTDCSIERDNSGTWGPCLKMTCGSPHLENPLKDFAAVEHQGAEATTNRSFSMSSACATVEGVEQVSDPCPSHSPSPKHVSIKLPFTPRPGLE